MYEVQNMDSIDRIILNYIQKQFPISERPYFKIANDLHLDENDVKNRIKNLYENGYIIKIIPKFSTRFYEKYERALVAMKIKENEIERAVQVINSFENITHNYLREHEYNVWFTVSGKNADEIKELVEKISKELDVKDYMILKSVKTLKLDTEFEVSE